MARKRTRVKNESPAKSISTAGDQILNSPIAKKQKDQKNNQVEEEKQVEQIDLIESVNNKDTFFESTRRFGNIFKNLLNYYT